MACDEDGAADERTSPHDSEVRSLGGVMIMARLSLLMSRGCWDGEERGGVNSAKRDLRTRCGWGRGRENECGRGCLDVVAAATVSNGDLSMKL